MIPSDAIAWIDRLRETPLDDAARAWLRAHLTAPGCRATEAALEAATGGDIAAYRALASRLGGAPPEPLDAIASRDGDGWTLRPALAFALGVRRVLPTEFDRGGKPAAELAPPPGESPIIVLVRPQLADNIGAVARAMANGGLFHLRLVAPRDGWPQDRAWRTASGADRILDAAGLYPDVASAVADCHRVLATCPRPRHVIKPVATARGGVAELRDANGRGLRAAVLFGPERAGLDVEDMAAADLLVRYPLNPAHMSLNLAQAVMVLAHEWWTAADSTPVRELVTHETRIATRAELDGFLDRLVGELDASGFLDHAAKRAGMVRNLRHWFVRGEVTEQELRTLHGVVTELSRGRARRGRPDPG